MSAPDPCPMCGRYGTVKDKGQTYECSCGLVIVKKNKKKK